MSALTPNDQQEYSTSLTFTLSFPPTTLDITSVTWPLDAYKGVKLPVTVSVKNTGQATAVAIGIYLYTESIKAKGSRYPYKNSNGAIVLVDETYFPTTISPGQTKYFYVDIDYGNYHNGALNVGEWELDKVMAAAANAPSDEFTAGYSFTVNAKTKPADPHPVFIYYLWNSGGAGDDFGGDNPRNYFTNGYGLRKAGLWRFETYASNIPVRFKMIICYDDSTWSIPSNLKKASQMMDNGKSYVGNKLDLYGNHWWYTNKIHTYNCGFDVLLMAAGRKAEDAMGLAYGNYAIVCKAGRGTWEIFWKNNIDGLAQHELSHLLGCHDWEGGTEHPALPWPGCIMLYGDLTHPFDYLHEYLLGVYNDDVTTNWCTCTDPFCCNPVFNANWNRYYSC